MTATSTAAGAKTGTATTPLVIVSCDTHIGPRLDADLRPYCPTELLDDFDAYAGELRAEARGGRGRRERVAFGGKNMGADWGVRTDEPRRRSATTTCTPDSRTSTATASPPR